MKTIIIVKTENHRDFLLKELKKCENVARLNCQYLYNGNYKISYVIVN